MKSVLTYVLLVGAPAAGVLGIIHKGEGLRAPHEVEGEWQVELAGKAAPGAMKIQQSGPHLSITLPGANGAVDGRIEGLAVEAPPAAGCTSPAVRARLERATRTLTGEIVGDGCVATPFRATRAERAVGGGAH